MDEKKYVTAINVKSEFKLMREQIYNIAMREYKACLGTKQIKWAEAIKRECLEEEKGFFAKMFKK